MSLAMFDLSGKTALVTGAKCGIGPGTPEDFAGPVVFLASNASNYVNGEILTVDGGWMGR